MKCFYFKAALHLDHALLRVLTGIVNSNFLNKLRNCSDFDLVTGGFIVCVFFHTMYLNLTGRGGGGFTVAGRPMGKTKNDLSGDTAANFSILHKCEVPTKMTTFTVVCQRLEN